MDKHKKGVDGFRRLPEAVVYKQAQAGCRACLDQLMVRHKGLVVFVTQRQVLGKLSYEEAIQAGRIGLWKAIQSYDMGKGYAFSSYAYPAVARHIWSAVKRAERSQASVAAGVSAETVETTNPELIWEASRVRRGLYDLVRRLPERLGQVIIARYGLDGKRPALYREIGGLLGVSGERARQLHLEALVWLRHPAHSQDLRSLLNRHTVADYELANALAQRWLRYRRGGHYDDA
jgi:RNA polymerase sporulation-specific sigma factor